MYGKFFKKTFLRPSALRRTKILKILSSNCTNIFSVLLEALNKVLYIKMTVIYSRIQQNIIELLILKTKRAVNFKKKLFFTARLHDTCTRRKIFWKILPSTCTNIFSVLLVALYKVLYIKMTAN